MYWRHVTGLSVYFMFHFNVLKHFSFQNCLQRFYATLTNALGAFHSNAHCFWSEFLSHFNSLLHMMLYSKQFCNLMFIWLQPVAVEDHILHWELFGCSPEISMSIVMMPVGEGVDSPFPESSSLFISALCSKTSGNSSLVTPLKPISDFFFPSFFGRETSETGSGPLQYNGITIQKQNRLVERIENNNYLDKTASISHYNVWSMTLDGAVLCFSNSGISMNANMASRYLEQRLLRRVSRPL